MKGATVKTLGCRLNIWESEVIRDHTRGRAFDNAVIVNSCAVTADAEKQTRKTIRTARREQPDARIIVTGCAAQINPDAWRNMAEVDDVVGNHEKLHPAYWNSFRYDKTPRASIGDIMEVREVAAHLLSGLITIAVLFCKSSKDVTTDALSVLFPMDEGQADQS